MNPVAGVEVGVPAGQADQRVGLARADQPNEPTTLPREVVAAAAAFQGYMDRAAGISSLRELADQKYPWKCLAFPSSNGLGMFADRLMEAHGFRREELRVKRGTGLIWSSNIVHGGTAITREGSTRHSFSTETCVASSLS